MTAATTSLRREYLRSRVGHLMEWLDEQLPHRAMWLPGRRLICSAADTSYGWGPDATDWQEKSTGSTAGS